MGKKAAPKTAPRAKNQAEKEEDWIPEPGPAPPATGFFAKALATLGFGSQPPAPSSPSVGGNSAKNLAAKPLKEGTDAPAVETAAAPTPQASLAQPPPTSKTPEKAPAPTTPVPPAEVAAPAPVKSKAAKAAASAPAAAPPKETASKAAASVPAAPVVATASKEPEVTTVQAKKKNRKKAETDAEEPAPPVYEPPPPPEPVPEAEPVPMSAAAKKKAKAKALAAQKAAEEAAAIAAAEAAAAAARAAEEAAAAAAQAAAAKKKKRKSTKKQEEGDSAQADSVVRPSPLGPTGAELADLSTEKDEDYVLLRGKLAEIEDCIASQTGSPASWRSQLEALAVEAEKVVGSRKAAVPRGSRQPSEKLLQSVQELKEAGHHDMAKDVLLQVDEARQAEVHTSWSKRIKGIKARCEELLRTAAAPPKQPVTKAELAPGAGGEGAPLRGEAEEQAVLNKLAELHSKSVEAVEKMKLSSQKVEVLPDLMKYLFTQPFLVHKSIEKEFKVSLEGLRVAKGGGKGKGNKGTQLGKEVLISGLAADEVNKCAAMINGLYVRTQDVSSGVTTQVIQKIEQDLGVYAFKQRASLTVIGSKKNLEAAFAKAEAEEETTVAVPIDAEKMKLVKSMLSSWMSATKTKMWVAVGGESGPRVLIASNKQDDIAAAKHKVLEFVKLTKHEFVSGDFSKVAQSQVLGRKLRELQENASATVVINRRPDGVHLTGPGEDVQTLKVALLELLSSAERKPDQLKLVPEQARTFDKETLARIMYSTGAEVWVNRGDKVSDLHLAIFGTEEQMANARIEAEKALQLAGAAETLPISEEASKALLERKGQKVQEMEGKHGVSLSIDRRTQQITIVGAVEKVKAAKKVIAKWVEKVDQDAADTIVKQMSIDSSAVPRIIGKRGATIANIRNVCHVEITIPKAEERDSQEDESPTRTVSISIKGLESAVSKAEQMINEIATWDRKEKGKGKGSGPHAEDGEKATAKPDWTEKAIGADPNGGGGRRGRGKGKGGDAEGSASGKTNGQIDDKAGVEQFKGSLAEDFPTLCEEEKPGSSRKLGGHWGMISSTKEDDGDADPASKYPPLGGVASMPVDVEAEDDGEEAEVEEEEREKKAEEVDDEDDADAGDE